MKVLVGDANATDAAVAAVALVHSGFEVVTRIGLADVIAAVIGTHVDLIVAGGNLAAEPAEVCKRLRRHTVAALMILAARASEDEQVCLLEAGADDYLAKPVRPAALVARAKALIRRAHIEQRMDVLTYGNLSIDLNERLMTWGQADPVRLSASEARFLQALVMRAGQIVPDKHLLGLIWKDPERGTAQALKQLAHRIRVKLRHSSSELTIVRHPEAGGYCLQTIVRPMAPSSLLDD